MGCDNGRYSISERSYNHVTFKVSKADFEEYIEKARKFGLDIVEGRSRIKGEGRSVYFYDFDNHLFELHTGTLSARLSCYSVNLQR
jgi:predicted enzyme related to lactoylglutathione lyase